MNLDLFVYATVKGFGPQVLDALIRGRLSGTPTPAARVRIGDKRVQALRFTFPIRREASPEADAEELAVRKFLKHLTNFTMHGLRVTVRSNVAKAWLEGLLTRLQDDEATPIRALVV